MQTGLHVMEQTRWRGRDPADGYGIIDFCRVVSGEEEKPTSDDPIVVTGLTDLLEASDGDPADRLQPIRRALHRGKPYFEWQELPVVFLVRGELLDHQGETPVVERGDERWSLEPLFGQGLRPAEEGETDGWYSPQFD